MVSGEHIASTLKVITTKKIKEATARRMGDKERAVDKRLDELFYDHKDDGATLKLPDGRTDTLPIYNKCTGAFAETQLARRRIGEIRVCPPGQEARLILAGQRLPPTTNMEVYGLSKLSCIYVIYKPVSMALAVASPSALPNSISSPTPTAALLASVEDKKQELESQKKQMKKTGNEPMFQLITAIMDITKNYLNSFHEIEIKKGLAIVSAVCACIKNYVGNPYQMYQQFSKEWVSKDSLVYQTLNKIVSRFKPNGITKLKTAVKKIGEHPRQGVDSVSSNKKRP